MVDDNILHKIRQLFAMAEHETANEHEAATALEKAQALLLRHNLTRATIGTTPEAPTSPSVGQVKVHEDSGYSWRKNLLHVVAKNNLCQSIGHPDERSSTIFGSQENVRSVLEMYYWVVEQLERMALDEFKAYKLRGGSEKPEHFKAGFFRGATATINTRLTKPLEEFKYGSGRDLVLVSDKALSLAVGKVFPNTVRSRGSSARIGDGYYHGKEAGNDIQFGKSAALTGGHKALGSGR
jgi:hypothetical protein